MKEGKIPSELLRKLVFDNIRIKNDDILIRPEIGEDCAAIDFGDYACVLTTDPITGAQAGAGTLAVHISCNDIASAGVKPLAVMLTIMAPVGTKEEDISRVMKEASEAAYELDVDIIGGHTEITSAVNRMIISTTAVGKTLKSKLVTTAAAKAGDDVVMTKWAGLEGTSIIAADKKDKLTGVLNESELLEAQSLIKHISVVKEGILAAEFGVNSMHDITEGGLLGAAWEVAESSKLGIEIDIDAVPMKDVTEKICSHLGINPYRLISSGSLIITCKNGHGLVETMKAQGINAAVIGRVTESGVFTVDKDGNKKIIEPPDVDELFRIG